MVYMVVYGVYNILYMLYGVYMVYGECSKSGCFGCYIKRVCFEWILYIMITYMIFSRSIHFTNKYNRWISSQFNLPQRVLLYLERSGPFWKCAVFTRKERANSRCRYEGGQYGSIWVNMGVYKVVYGCVYGCEYECEYGCVIMIQYVIQCVCDMIVYVNMIIYLNMILCVW